MIKMIAMMRRKPGLSHEEFLRYWYQNHGPLVVKTIPGLRKYVQNHPAASAAPGVKSDFDGIAEGWFDDIEAFNKFVAWRASDRAKELRDDVDRFVDWENSVTMAAEEKIIKPA